MRRLMWRLGRLFDLGVLLAALSFTAVSVGLCMAGALDLAGCSAMVAACCWATVVMLVRSDSFMQPW